MNPHAIDKVRIKKIPEHVPIPNHYYQKALNILSYCVNFKESDKDINPNNTDLLMAMEIAVLLLKERVRNESIRKI